VVVPVTDAAVILSLYAPSQFVCEVVVGSEYPLAYDRDSVPALVTGELLTVKPVGAANPTEVTVPLTGVAQVKLTVPPETALADKTWFTDGAAAGSVKV
jgi:hypothetical protein